MNIPATKEEILENFKKNNNGRPLNKDDYEVAEALSRITYKAYEVGMEDAKQMNMEDMMDNKRCNALHVFKSKSFGQRLKKMVKFFSVLLTWQRHWGTSIREMQFPAIVGVS